jgi:hypothetical protein
MRRVCVVLCAGGVLLGIVPSAAAYGWPLKPFGKEHPLRGTFGDPRFHLDAEGQLSAFHFGIDIVARDGAPVYAVEPGVVVRRHATSVTIGRRSGRRYGYWHVLPVVRSGTHVKLHQLIGHVARGWGHVHFAESFKGSYRNPLRKGAIAPYYDHTAPTVASVQILRPDGSAADTTHVAGAVDISADIFDTPTEMPPSPWDVARFVPAAVSWTLSDASGAEVESTLAVNFGFGLPPNALYPLTYVVGSYQNKPHRPGHYVFWLAHGLDTTGFADGPYTLEVLASDTRNNVGRFTVPLVVANGALAHG